MTVRTKHGWIALASAVTLLAGAAQAKTPPGRYAIATFTVKDTRTGLIWQRTPATGAQAEAMSNCATLNTSGLGGYTSGWRLPTMLELLSIVDVTESSPAIDKTAFPGVYEFFWTATGYAPSSDEGWIVDFTDGSAKHATRVSTYQAICVR